MTLSSSGYHDNSFHLTLPNPVEGGSYTCRVPPATACLHGNGTREATLTVDKMEARLAVLEARQSALEGKNVHLENENNAMKIVIGNLNSNRNPFAIVSKGNC